VEFNLDEVPAEKTEKEARVVDEEGGGKTVCGQQILMERNRKWPVLCLKNPYVDNTVPHSIGKRVCLSFLGLAPFE
jgi:hypothetical protein